MCVCIRSSPSLFPHPSACGMLRPFVYLLLCMRSASLSFGYVFMGGCCDGWKRFALTSLTLHPLQPGFRSLRLCKRKPCSPTSEAVLPCGSRHQLLLQRARCMEARILTFDTQVAPVVRQVTGTRLQLPVTGSWFKQGIVSRLRSNSLAKRISRREGRVPRLPPHPSVLAGRASRGSFAARSPSRNPRRRPPPLRQTGIRKGKQE